MYTRLIASSLGESTADTPVTFVAGARRTGKSTLVEQFTGDGWAHRTFDDLGVLSAARGDPQGFIEALDRPTVLDEIQRAPELFLPLKRAVDRDRRPGRFVLTGSANVLVLPRVADSLAGRMEILSLWPLAQCELEAKEPGFIDACFEGKVASLAPDRCSRADLWARMLRGGYPEAVDRGPDARARWFDGYLATLLQRDLRDLADIAHLAEVPALLRTLAARTGGPLNVADVSRTLQLNQVTAKRYLSLLEALFLVVRVPAWFENFGKKLAKASKHYIADSGLHGHLLDLDAAGLERDPRAAGPLAETFVVGELIRLAPHARMRPRVHHLRTSQGVEVDVVLESRKGTLVGVEVKAGATVGAADFKGLRYLRDSAGSRCAAGILLYAGTTTLPFGDRLWAVPMSALWAGRSPRT